MKQKLHLSFLTTLLTLAMVFSVSVTCFAAGTAQDSTGIEITQHKTSEGQWTFRLSTGAFMSRGLHVHGPDVEPIYGIQAEWDIDETFNLRLGYERTQPGVDDNSVLEMSRIPFMLVSNVRESGPFQDFYYGMGMVHSITHYSDSHFPDVGKSGPAAFIGFRMNRKWNCELMYNHMKRYGREYGGYMLNITYEIF